MSIYFSRFGLNTYAGTPYFQAQLPEDYPFSKVLQKSRAFRRLPPNLRKLAALSKRWAEQFSESLIEESKGWYDESGNELDQDTGRQLSDQDIDDQWTPNPDLDKLVVIDIPIPKGGFPNPDEWEPEEVGAKSDTADAIPVSQFLKDVASRGIKAAERAYGIDLGYTQPESAIGMDYNKAKKLFSERAAVVVASPYFKGSDKELDLLTHALKNTSIYEDLAGLPQDIFDRAEEYNFAANHLDLLKEAAFVN